MARFIVDRQNRDAQRLAEDVEAKPSLPPGSVVMPNGERRPRYVIIEDDSAKNAIARALGIAGRLIDGEWEGEALIKGKLLPVRIRVVDYVEEPRVQLEVKDDKVWWDAKHYGSEALISILHAFSGHRPI